MRRRSIGFALTAVFGFLACATGSFAADVQLLINDGRLTLDAHDASMIEILAEWSRVGQTSIVGGEKLAGAPVTIRMVDVPERAALDVLLRDCAGYAALEWPAGSAGPSIYRRIVIVPASTTTAVPDRSLSVRSSTFASRAGVAATTGRRTARPSIDVTPRRTSGVALDSDTPGSTQPDPVSAIPWFPEGSLSRIPGVVAPSAQNPAGPGSKGVPRDQQE